MGKTDSEGIARAMANLRELIERLTPNLISDKEVMQAYFWVYAGMRYSERNQDLRDAFQYLREAGCGYGEAYRKTVGIYHVLGRSSQGLAVLHSMLPTHVALLNNLSRAIIRPSDCILRYELAEPETSAWPRGLLDE